MTSAKSRANEIKTNDVSKVAFRVTDGSEDKKTILPALEHHFDRPDLDDRFELLEPVGEGAMAYVWKVREKSIDQILALKLLRKELTQDPEAVSRFQQEARLTMQLEHPHIAAVYEPGNDKNGRPYILMDFVPGETLQQLLAREGKLAEERALGIFEQICQALSYAHMHGIVHRDIKPSNIMIDSTESGADFVKVVDFGIARSIPEEVQNTQALTRPLGDFATPRYMSPEQCLGQEITPQSDIYSLGCVLHEMVSGAPPFTETNQVRLILQHLNQSPALNHFSFPLRSRLFLCLAKNPQMRVQSVDWLIDLSLDDMKGEDLSNPVPQHTFALLTAACVCINLTLCAQSMGMAGYLLMQAVLCLTLAILCCRGTQFAFFKDAFKINLATFFVNISLSDLLMSFSCLCEPPFKELIILASLLIPFIGNRAKVGAKLSELYYAAHQYQIKKTNKQMRLSNLWIAIFAVITTCVLANLVAWFAWPLLLIASTTKDAIIMAGMLIVACFLNLTTITGEPIARLSRQQAKAKLTRALIITNAILLPLIGTYPLAKFFLLTNAYTQGITGPSSGLWPIYVPPQEKLDTCAQLIDQSQHSAYLGLFLQPLADDWHTGQSALERSRSIAASYLQVENAILEGDKKHLMTLIDGCMNKLQAEDDFVPCLRPAADGEARSGMSKERMLTNLYEWKFGKTPLKEGGDKQ